MEEVDKECLMITMGVMSECFFWYRPTQIVPDQRPLNGCVQCRINANRGPWQLFAQGPLLTPDKLLLQPFNGLFSRTTWVSRYQKGKTNLDFTTARDSEWQWHQLGHMQVCTLLQRYNNASTSLLSFTGRMPFMPPNQQCQSTWHN